MLPSGAVPHAIITMRTMQGVNCKWSDCRLVLKSWQGVNELRDSTRAEVVFLEMELEKEMQIEKIEYGID